MATATYQTVVLAQRPKDAIVPGETFRLESVPRPTEADLKNGDVLIEALYLSLDPAMRGWLNDARSYIPPVPIDGVMRGAVIGKVVATKSSTFSVGEYVNANSGWAEVAIVKEKELQKLEVPANGKVTDGLGVLGLTGLTAYFGLLDVGKVKAGDFVVVSGAAGVYLFPDQNLVPVAIQSYAAFAKQIGATGSVVSQIAKLKGARVLGLAGSDDKVQWLKDLGLDDALNYKDPEFAKKFRNATKDFIDVFFDNVGGEILDLALSRANQHARFVICGAISQYNSANPQGPKNYMNIISMRIRMQGFIVFDYAAQYTSARKELAQWLAEGKIQRKETIVKGGLKAAEQALVDLYNGINTGKLLVEVKPDEATPDKSRL